MQTTIKKLSANLANLPWFTYAVVLLFTGAIYLPIANQPILRTTGDEKVYVAQALEMAQRGSWFIQTLADEPSYYKGPLFYQFIRVGFLVFGTSSMWATLWMNFLGLAIAACALAHHAQNHFKSIGAGILVGTAFVSCCGLYAHVFASQMEALLVVFYALAFVVLDRWRELSHSRQRSSVIPFLFWTLVATAGLLKSPIHSVLLGIGAFSVALFHRDLLKDMFRPAALAALAFGMLFGAAMYATPYFIDRQSFLDTYILRETLARGSNGKTVFEAVIPVFSVHIFPFWFLGWIGFAYLIKTRMRALDQRMKSSVILAALLALPTVVFFGFHGYRSEIYAMPILAMVLWIAASGWTQAREAWPRASKWSVRATAFAAFLMTVLVVFMQIWFKPESDWWPAWLGYVGAACGVGLFLLTIDFKSWSEKFVRSDYVVVAMIPWFLVLAGLLQALGARDLKDLRRIASQTPEKSHLGYYNVHHHTWSEWASLGTWIGYPVEGLHSDASVKDWLAAGNTLIVPGEEHLAELHRLVGPGSLEEAKWARWKVNRDVKNQNVLATTLRTKDLSLLQQEYYVVRYLPQ